jgi:hypothetical protein
MFKFFGFSALAISGLIVPAVQAGSISYSANIGCGNTCVTTSVEWSNFNPGVSFVVILDNNGDFLFGLNTDPFPEGTGQIDPNPQTVSGLSPEEVSLLTFSGVITGSIQSASLFEVTGNGPPLAPTYADLALEDVNGNILGETTFTASSAPEPATWAACALGLLMLAGIAGRRKLQTAPVKPESL